MSQPQIWSAAARRNDALLTLLLVLHMGFTWWAHPQLSTVMATEFCLVGLLLLYRSVSQMGAGAARQVTSLVGNGHQPRWFAWLLGGALVINLVVAYRVPSGLALVFHMVLTYATLFALGFLSLDTRVKTGLWLLMTVMLNNALAIPRHVNEQYPLATPGLLMATAVMFMFLSFTNRQAFAKPMGEVARTAPGGGRALVAMALLLGVTGALALPLALVKVSLTSVVFPSLGGLPAISTSSEPVMYATFTGPAPEKPYWRQYIPYAYTQGDGNWSVSLGNQDTNSPAIEDLTGTLFSDEVKDNGGLKYVYLKKNHTLDAIATFLDGRTGRMEEVAEQVTRNEAYDRFKQVRYRPFTASDDAAYLSIPLVADKPLSKVDMGGAVVLMPKTLALVNNWKREGLTEEQFVARTLEYFSQNLAYHFDHQSMDPERNGVDYFLFEEKKGVCRHFANAFALMMRMYGIRSRIVGGYSGGEFDEETNTWTVRKRDAHVWVEVWLESQQQWVSIDPTAVVPVEKGVPKDGRGLFRSWFDFKSKDNRSLEDVEKGMQTFSTAGEVGPSWKLPLLPLVLLGLLGLLVWALPRARRAWVERPVIAAEQRQWDLLIQALLKKGVRIQPHQGPATIGRLFAPSLPAEDRVRWMETVRAFEQWKFGQVHTPGLARDLANWRRQIERKQKA